MGLAVQSELHFEHGVAPGSRGPLVIREESGTAAVLEALAQPWRKLCVEVEAEPFLRPEVVLAYLRAFSPRARLRVTSVWSGQRLVAILPLVEEKRWLYGVPLRYLRSAANIHSCRFDCVVAAGTEGAAAQRMLWGAMAERRDWDALALELAPAGGALDHLAGEARASDRPTFRQLMWSSFRLPLDSPAALSAKFRYSLGRGRRQLEKTGPVRLVHVAAADAAALHRFYELERSGWKGRAGTAIACDPAMRRFYDEVAAGAAAGGYLSLDFLEAGGRPIAAHFALVAYGRYYVAKAAYDEAFRGCGPGHLLVQSVLAQAETWGLRELDFVGPATWDESRWAKDCRGHVRVTIFRRLGAASLAHSVRTACRTLVRRVIPERGLRATDGSSVIFSPRGLVERAE